MYVVLNGHEDAQTIANLTINLYDKNTSPDRLKVLDRCLDIVELTCKFMTFLYTGTIFLYLLTPFYQYFLKGELVLMYAVYLPFTDPKTNWGFAMNFGNQLFYIFYGLIGLVGVIFLQYSTSQVQITFRLLRLLKKLSSMKLA